MAASLPSTAAGWTDWMVSFMASTLGGADGAPERGRAPCSASERALGQARAATRAGARRRWCALAPKRCNSPRFVARFVALQALGADWASWGYDVAKEPFLCAPHAFLGAIPLAVLLWIRALRYYDARPWAAFVSCALGAGLFVLEVVMYREALEVLGIFPVSQGAPPVSG